MSAEKAHLIEQEDNNDENEYETVLILKNNENDPSKETIQISSIRKNFFRIFKSDEKIEKYEIIQEIEDACDNFLKKSSSENVY